MPISKNSNLSKFGTRRFISNISDVESMRIKSLTVLSINGVAVKDTDENELKQSDDILFLQQKVDDLEIKQNNLEKTVYELKQIIFNLRT